MHTEPDRERRVAELEGHPPRKARRAHLAAASTDCRRRGPHRTGLADTAHPLLAQIVPIRRCNIDCAGTATSTQGLASGAH